MSGGGGDSGDGDCNDDSDEGRGGEHNNSDEGVHMEADDRLNVESTSRGERQAGDEQGEEWG